jgi:FAD/FMN-containing dehydrogenase
MALKDEIGHIIAGEAFDDKATLQKYANDASLFEVRPKLVVFPKNIADLQVLIRFVSEHKKDDPTLSLTARAAGTDMTGGSLTESVVVDMMKYLNHIQEVGEGYAISELGVFYRDFEKETLKTGQIMPSYPASKNLCALGGIVSNNSSGEKTLSYGSTKDYVERLKVVLRDGNEYEFGPLSRPELDAKMAQNDFEGEIYRRVFELIENNKALIEEARPRVSKNSTGYFIWDVWDGTTFNLARLFVGSQGTLGFLTEVKFRLVRPKTHSKMLVMFLKQKDFPRLGEMVNAVLKTKPESFESYDDHTLGLALKYFPEMLRTMKGRVLSLALRFLPEVWMILTSGFPKLVLLAEFTGDSEREVTNQAKDAQLRAAQFGLKTRLTRDAADAEKYWAIRRESFNLLRKHIKKARTAPFIDDMIVRPEQLPEFLPRLNEIMGHYNLTYTIAGHIGDANFHIMPLMDFTKPEAKKIFDELTQKVFDLVIEFKGSLSAEHNDGIIRTPFLKKRYGEDMYRVFETIKNIFDPERIFNPGKKIGDTWSYAMDHIDTEY